MFKVFKINLESDCYTTSAKDRKFNTIKPPAVNRGGDRQLLNANIYNARIFAGKVYHGDSYL